MNCIICNSIVKETFRNTILEKYEIQYYQCENCACIFTEKPYWLEEAYEDSITSIDTGIMMRNIDFSIITNQIIKLFFNKDKMFLDYAGGYGIFTRMMRDLGYNFRWYDKYSENLLARGYESADDFEEKFELITLFEALEHFDNPLKEIEDLLKMGDSLLLSTLLYDSDFKLREPDWWYYVTETGQHITIYSEITMKYLAKKFNMNYYKITNELHLFTKEILNPKKVKRMQKMNSKLNSIIHLLEWRLSKKHSKSKEDMYNQKAIRKGDKS